MYTKRNIDPRRYVQDLIQNNVLNCFELSKRSGVSRRAITRFLDGKRVWIRTVKKIVSASREAELEMEAHMSDGDIDLTKKGKEAESGT